MCLIFIQITSTVTNSITLGNIIPSIYHSLPVSCQKHCSCEDYLLKKYFYGLLIHPVSSVMLVSLVVSLRFGCHNVTLCYMYQSPHISFLNVLDFYVHSVLSVLSFLSSCLSVSSHSVFAEQGVFLKTIIAN